MLWHMARRTTAERLAIGGIANGTIAKSRERIDWEENQGRVDQMDTGRPGTMPPARSEKEIA